MRPTAALLIVCAVLSQRARADEPPAAPPADAHATAATQPGAATSAAGNDAATAAPRKAAPDAASTQIKPDLTVVAAKAQLTADEKDLINRGYKLEVRDGEKYFCRKEQEIGSRFEHKVCDTAQSIQARRAESQEAVRVIQTNNSRVGN